MTQPRNLKRRLERIRGTAIDAARSPVDAKDPLAILNNALARHREIADVIPFARLAPIEREIADLLVRTVSDRQDISAERQAIAEDIVRFLAPSQKDRLRSAARDAATASVAAVVVRAASRAVVELVQRRKPSGLSPIDRRAPRRVAAGLATDHSSTAREWGAPENADTPRARLRLLKQQLTGSSATAILKPESIGTQGEPPSVRITTPMQSGPRVSRPIT